MQQHFLNRFMKLLVLVVVLALFGVAALHFDTQTAHAGIQNGDILDLCGEILFAEVFPESVLDEIFGGSNWDVGDSVQELIDRINGIRIYFEIEVVEDLGDGFYLVVVRVVCVEPQPEPDTCSDLLDSDRINQDCAAPVAIFNGSFVIYGINPDTGDGQLDLTISDERIAEVGVPDVNTLLGEGVNSFTGQPIRVFRLASGEFQLNTWYADGKPYIITWEAGGTNVIYIAA